MKKATRGDFYEYVIEMKGIPFAAVISEDLGAYVSIVIRLFNNLSTGLNKKIHFGNWYTTVPILVQLAHRVILALGTLRRNKIPKSIFK